MPPTEAKMNQNIRHYCRKIERHPNERVPLLRALEVLDSLRGISIAALSETGAGRAVKGLKRHVDQEVATRAKALVAKWKELVQREGEEEDKEEDTLPRPIEAVSELEEEQRDPPEERAQDDNEPKRKKSQKRDRPEKEEDGSKRSRSSSSSSKRHKESNRDSRIISTLLGQEHKSSSSSSSRRHHKSSKKSKMTADDAFDNALTGLAETLSAPQKQSKRSQGSSSSSNNSGGHRSSSKHTSSDTKSSISCNSANKNNPDFERPIPSSSRSTSAQSRSPTVPVSPTVPLNLCTEYKPLRQPLPIRGATTNGTPHRLGGATDDGALSDMLASMKKAKGGRRPAVYSGTKRSGYSGSVPSLMDICIRTLQENVDDIAECGGLPYSILSPVLERASPPTLTQIEECNPYLLEDTGGLWERFVRKNFPKNEREEMETWREMFERCTLEREQKLDMLKTKVKGTYKRLDQSQKKTKLAYVDVVAKPPRGVKRAQERNGIFSQVGTPHRLGSDRPRPVAVREPRRGSSGKAKVAPMMAKALRMAKGFRR